MPPLAGIAAKIVAPMVANIASGLIQNVAGQALRNLQLMGDSFQKIAGGMSQIFGGISQVAGGLGQLNQLLAPRGMFPSPAYYCGLPSAGRLPFGPRWPGLVDLQQLVQRLERLLSPNDPLMRGLGQVGETFNKILDALNRLLERMGQPTTQPGGGFYGPFFPFPPAIAATAPPGVGGFGGGGGLEGVLAKAPTGEALEGVLGKAFDAMASIEQQIASIDPTKPEGMKQMMLLQFRMQRIQQMIQTVNEIRKAMHDSVMSVIRNIR
jgi:X-X-X-Leu-X-X-Gly heptad repeat protein